MLAAEMIDQLARRSGVVCICRGVFSLVDDCNEIEQFVGRRGRHAVYDRS